MAARAPARLGLTVCILALAFSAAGAQDSTHVVPVDTLDVTVVRASTPLSHVPAALTVVNRADIQSGRPGIGLDEALAQVPGVVVNNRYNSAQGIRISIRGFGSRAAFGVRGIKLIEDGIPLTMPDGQSTLNNIDLSSTARIEVLRGAASMLYGNAAGGVIEIHSEDPLPGFSAQLRGLAGDLGRSSVDDLGKLELKAAGGSERTRFLVSGNRVKSDGYRDHSRFQQTNLNGRLVHTFSARAQTALTLNAYDSPYADDPGALPRDSVSRNPQMAWGRNVATGAGKSGRQMQLGITHEQHFGAATLDATVYGVTRTLDNPLTFAYIMLDRTAGGIRSTLSWHLLTFGIDADRQADKRREYDNTNGTPGANQRRNQIDRIATLGPFVRAMIPLGARATVSAGVRYDRASFSVSDHFLADGRDDSGSRTMSALSPAAGVAFELDHRITVFANLSTSFQTPTTTEMINTPPAPGQPCCAAGFNPLDPERATSAELGVRTNLLERVSLDAAIFDARVRDKIVAYQVANADGRDFYRNAGSTTQRGIEIALKADLATGLRMTTSYSYSRFRFQDDGVDSTHYEGNQLPGVPPHHLLVRMTASAADLILEPEVEWTSAYFADDANSAQSRNPAATVSNLRIRTGRAIGGLTPFAAINNVFDTRYSSSVVINAAGGRFFEPAAGRNFFLGVSARLGHGGLQQ